MDRSREPPPSLNSESSRLSQKSAIFSYLHLAVGLVSMVWLTPVILNHLGKAVYGFWAVLNSILEYFRMFDFGLNTAVSKYTSEYRALNRQDKLTRLVSTTLMGMVCIGGLLILACLLLAQWVPGWFDLPSEYFDEGRTAFVIMGINVAFMLSSGVLVSTVYGFERVDIWKLFGMVQLATYTLLAISCVYLGLGLIGVLLASLSSTLVLILLYIRFLKKSDYPISYHPKNAKMDTLREIAPYSLRTFSMVLSSRIQYSTDNIVIGVFLGAAMVGPYEIAYKLCFLMTYLFSVLSSMAFPRFSKLYAVQDFEQLQLLYLKISKLSVAIMSGLGVVLIFYGKPFIDLWVGPGNFVGYETFFILVMIDMVHSFASPAGTLLQGIGKNRGLTYSEALNAGLNLLFSLIFIQFWGWIGVAFGTLLAQLLTSGWFAPVQACKHLKIPFARFIRYSIIPPSISGGLTLLLLFMVQDALWASIHLYQLALSAIITVLIFILFFYLFGLSTTERREYAAWLKVFKTKS